jgi:cob(I)alamin adenosyltransferase
VANRLTKIYTRTGDDGTTGLADGSRVDKDSARVEAIGEVDELNSAIGVLLAQQLPDTIREPLTSIQHDLFDLGGELAIPGTSAIGQAQVASLERLIDGFNGDLPPLKEFILPGGSAAAVFCHIARTRRAERRVVTLSKSESVAPASIEYLNRSSDLLFVLYRVLNRHHGVSDVYWRPGANR